MISQQIKNNGERQFAELLESQNIEYIYQPKSIRIGFDKWIGGCIWKPDFYLPDEDKYIEVISQQTAYSSRKYKFMQAIYDGYNLELKKPNGEKYIPNDILKLKKRSHLQKKYETIPKWLERMRLKIEAQQKHAQKELV